MTHDAMTRLIFIHSPIQIAILNELIRDGRLGSDDTFIFHRNQRPPESFRLRHVFSANYVLNDVPFITALLNQTRAPIEIVLPHSLCYAFHLAEALDQVKGISYIEEGTGTLYAIKNQDFRFRLKKHARSLFDRIRLIVKLVIALRSPAAGPITTALAADRKFRDNANDRFIDFQSLKMRHIYSMSPWHDEDAIYKPVSMPVATATCHDRSILIAIGKSDIVLDGYWDLIDRITRGLETLGLSYKVKLHPSIKQNALKGSNRLRDAFLARAKTFDPAEDELGFAIIKHGFLGAVSFFSSYQVYAHTLSQSLRQEFPMLSLERALGRDDYAAKAASLPDCGLMNNIYLDVDSWQEKIAELAGKRWPTA